jgi:hypothetical protein
MAWFLDTFIDRRCLFLRIGWLRETLEVSCLRLTNPCRCEERMFCKLGARTLYERLHTSLHFKFPLKTGEMQVFHLILNTEVVLGFGDICCNMCSNSLTCSRGEGENRSWRKLCVFV